MQTLYIIHGDEVTRYLTQYYSMFIEWWQASPDIGNDYEWYSPFTFPHSYFLKKSLLSVHHKYELKWSFSSFNKMRLFCNFQIQCCFAIQNRWFSSLCTSFNMTNRKLVNSNKPFLVLVVIKLFLKSNLLTFLSS